MPWNLNIWDVFDEWDTDGSECSRKVVSGRRVAGAISSLVNARDFPTHNEKSNLETQLNVGVQAIMFGLFIL